MKKNKTDIERFILWFSKLEEVPLQGRHDLLSHVLSIGYIDEKSEQFIEATLANLSKRSQQRQSEWKKYHQILKVANTIQKDKSLSLKAKIANQVIGWMNEKFKSFKLSFQKEEAKEMKVAESAEDLEDSSQVARLKAAL